jgi:hypothetical protein
MNRYQSGFSAMFGMLLTLSVASVLLVVYQSEERRGQLDNDAMTFQKYLLHVKSQINAYEADRLIALGTGASPTGVNTLPPNWAALSPIYLPSCPASEAAAGRCRQVDVTPWGNAMGFNRQQIAGSSNYRIAITVPFPVLNDATRSLHNTYRAALATIPGWTYNTATRVATINIERIGQELQHTALVKRSGNDSTLTGDWDVGGAYSIVNARDITIRGAAGSQRSVASGVIRTLVVRHGDRVNKPDCPSGLTPDLTTAIKGIYNQSVPNRFESVSSSRAYHVNASSFWTVGLDYYAKVEGVWQLLHDGEVSVSVLCV